MTLAFGLRIVLAAVFGFAGLAKAMDLPGSRRAAAGFGLPAWLAAPTGNLLPAAELIIAALLIPGATAPIGEVAAFALLGAFVVAMTWNLLRGRRPDCHCFGQVRPTPISGNAVLRNITLMVGAGWLAVAAPPESYRENAVSGLASSFGLRGGEVVVAIVAVLVAAQALLVWQLFRQQGRLLLRIDDLERRLATGDALDGLPLGAAAPRFELLDSLLDRGSAVLVLFTDPNCGPCTSLLPAIATWQQESTPRLSLAVVSRGGVDANRTLAERHGIRNLVLQRGTELTDAYRVGGTPAGVLVLDDGRIGSATALGPEAITALRMTALAGGSSQLTSNVGNLTSSALSGAMSHGSAIR